MKTVLYECPYVPAEWIAAHGLRPSRVLPHAAGNVREGVCPYSAAFAAEAAVGDAVIFSTVCDQLRRAAERVTAQGHRAVFVLNMPSTWQTAAAFRLYVDELRRLGRFLVRLGGSEPTPAALAETIRQFESARWRLRQARGTAEAGEFSRLLAEFNRTGCPACVPAEAGRPLADLPEGRPRAGVSDGTPRVDHPEDRPQTHYPPGVPLALVGGPLTRDDFWIFDQAAECGGRIVLDATVSGELSVPPPMDGRRLGRAGLLDLAEAYFQIPHPSRRPNSLLYQWLARELPARGARGLLLRRHVWCDLWHAEVQRLREWTPLPVVDLDVTDAANARARSAQRIGALVETLAQARA